MKMRKLRSAFIEILKVVFPGIKWLQDYRKNNDSNFLKAGFRQHLWALRYGFLLDSIELCNINQLNKHEYLSDKIYKKMHPFNKAYSTIIDNKLYLPMLLKDFPELIPTYYYYIDKGRLLKLDLNQHPDQGLIQLCKEKSSIVFKKCYDSFGHGFHLLEFKNNCFQLDHKNIQDSEIKRFVDSLDNYIVTEYIHQHHYATEINSSSVNTIRMQCMWDYDKSEFFVARAFHRFGNEGYFVDNIGSIGGGIMVTINPQTGRTTKTGVLKEKGNRAKRIVAAKHPQSKNQIAEIEIPHWSEMKSKVLYAMNHLSFLKCVGLDVVITEDGFKILEVNSYTDLCFLQLEQGFLTDNRIKRIFLT